MFRVTRADEASRTVLTIDGELSGSHIAVIETCCEQAAVNGKPVDVYLRDVPDIAPSGRDLLRRLALKGVRLGAAGVYNSYVLAGFGPAGGQGESRKESKVGRRRQQTRR